MDQDFLHLAKRFFFSYFSVITKNWFIHKVKKNSQKTRREVQYEEVAKEIEQKIGLKPIDLEFAIDKNGNVNIFQIRPLTTSKNWKKISSTKLKKNLNKNRKLFTKINKLNSSYGDLPIFGLMPDWNPAEMIGYQPKNLSYSI